jgi:ribose transport system permease protein
MGRLIGVLVILAALYAVLRAMSEAPSMAGTHDDMARYLGFSGILTLGVGVLIVSGGIDLSIGSLVGLGAICFGLLLEKKTPVLTAAAIVIGMGAVIGLFHGLLVTRVGLQPFLVTLCGLFMYRGLAKWVGGGSEVYLRPGQPQVEELRRALVSGHTLGVPHELFLLLVVAALLGILLHASVYGRYWYAIGYNELAARYAGIPTKRYKVLAYVICSTLAGLGGILTMLETRNANPSNAGNLLELYAITGAVLGGCSLRGGEGTIAGMLLGAAVLPLLQQICFTPAIGSNLEYVVIGGALLLGTIGNEVVRRLSRAR